MRHSIAFGLVIVASCAGGSDFAAAQAASRRCVASSFADPADVAAYKAAIAAGASEAQALKVGDNGIGFWGDDTTSEKRPACALPREDWVARWGEGDVARGKKIKVSQGRKSVVCELLDTMPRKANIRNGACIDLNPAAAKALGATPPFMLKGVNWRWTTN